MKTNKLKNQEDIIIKIEDTIKTTNSISTNLITKRALLGILDKNN